MNAIQIRASVPTWRSRLDRLESDDLLAILRELDDDDLRLLFDILDQHSTAHSVGVRRIRDAKQRHSGKPPRYFIKLMEREILWLATHDVSWWQGRRPTYRQIVGDLAQRFRLGDLGERNILELEVALLPALAQTDSWFRRTMRRARENPARALFALGPSVLFRGAARFAGPIAIVAGTAFEVWRQLGPNHRVVAQCVRVIADARLRHWTAALKEIAGGRK